MPILDGSTNKFEVVQRIRYNFFLAPEMKVFKCLFIHKFSVYEFLNINFNKVITSDSFSNSNFKVIVRWRFNSRVIFIFCIKCIVLCTILSKKLRFLISYLLTSYTLKEPHLKIFISRVRIAATCTDHSNSTKFISNELNDLAQSLSLDECF